MKKDYWNKLNFFYCFVFICLMGFIWLSPVLSSFSQIRVIQITLTITWAVMFILIIVLTPIMKRRMLAAIAEKGPWELAKIQFDKWAVWSLVMIVIFFLLPASHLTLYPTSYPASLQYLLKIFSTFRFTTPTPTVLVFYAVASILFLVLASLFKRRSPKAIIVGYTSLVSLTILILVHLVVLFVSNSSADLSRGSTGFFEILLIIVLVRSVWNVHKVSKQKINQ